MVVTAALQRRIQAMEMRCYGKILRISYKDHVTNEEVRAKIQQAIRAQEEGLGVSPTRLALKSVSFFGTWGVSLKRPVLDCLLIRQLGSSSYTPRAGICQVVL